MSTRKTLLTEALSIKVMKVTFPIYRSKDGIINGLQTAIDDGTLNKLVEESAVQNTAGNTTEVIKALKKCLASYKVNIRKTASHIDMQIENLRIQTLEAWLNSFGSNTPQRAERYGRVENGKAKWDVTAEEIMQLVEQTENNAAALDATYKAVNSIYNCIASKLSKELSYAEAELREYKTRETHQDPTRVAQLEARVALKERIMMASAECTTQKALLRKRMDVLRSAAVDTTDKNCTSLLEKVQRTDTKVTLGKDEVAKLQEMLRAAGLLG